MKPLEISISIGNDVIVAIEIGNPPTSLQMDKGKEIVNQPKSISGFVILIPSWITDPSALAYLYLQATGKESSKDPHVGKNQQ